MVGNEPALTFAQEHAPSARRLRSRGLEGEGPFPSIGERERKQSIVLLRRMRVFERAATSPDTWDVTSERINRLWSVQMQPARPFPPSPALTYVARRRRSCRRLKSDQIECNHRAPIARAVTSTCPVADSRRVIRFAVS